MIQTWDWLFFYLPSNEEQQKIILENMDSQKNTEIRIRDFILKFDFENNNIYCDCVENYTFKHKVIPGKVPFAIVKEFLLTKDLGLIDWAKLKLLK